MIQTRTSRTLAGTGVTAVLLCALPAVGHTAVADRCDSLRDGQDSTDWARARSSHDHPALPDRQSRPLRTLIDVVDGRPDGQSFIDWARAQSAHNGQTASARPVRRAQPLDSLFSIAAADGK